MKMPHKPGQTGKCPPDTRLDAEARAWVIELSSGHATPAIERAFNDWRTMSPRHDVAFKRAWRLWDGLAEVEHVEQILTDRDNGAPLRPAPRISRRWLVGTGLAASLVCAAGIGVLSVSSTGAESIVLATQRGEIETFDLSDGSQITLGGASEVMGQFSAKARTLRLVEGNAYFDIARDPARPMTVDTHQLQVRVLGTRFDIKKRPDSVSISVDSGHVRVTTREDTRDLEAGDQVTSVAALRLGPVQSFNPEKELSWRTGRLSYIDTSLGDIIADINRYSDRPVRLASDAPANLRLTVSFSVQQIGHVLAGLDTAYPIDVNETEDEIVISKAF